jgi:DEAD/DEAH box helicase domain-containing protein
MGSQALAQDQVRSIRELVSESATLSGIVRCEAVDGDSSWTLRRDVQETAEVNIVASNPDFLHAAVLPGHKQWRRVLTNLAFVVCVCACVLVCVCLCTQERDRHRHCVGD